MLIIILLYFFSGVGGVEGKKGLTFFRTIKA